MGQAQINVRIRACSRTSIARTKQAALTHNVRGKELTRLRLNSSDDDVYKGSPNQSGSDHIRMITNINYHALPSPRQTTRESRLSIGRHWITDLQRRRSLAAARTFPDVARHFQCCH